MAKPLSDKLNQQLNELTRMGKEIDDQFSQWQADAGSAPEDVLEQMAHSVGQAQEMIAQLVETADQNQLLQHPDLLSLKQNWSARFARLEHCMEKAKNDINNQLTNTSQRHRAADAYLKNQ